MFKINFSMQIDSTVRRFDGARPRGPLRMKDLLPLIRHRIYRVLFRGPGGR